MASADHLRAAFIAAACVSMDNDPGSGTPEIPECILSAHPELAGSDIHTAAILGDREAVRRFLAADARHATAKAGPHGWDTLTHLCFSKYLRLDPARSEGFVSAARALLDAGASAKTGFYNSDHQPSPAWGSALYGAAGVAHHVGVSRLLVERGTDVNDDEVVYHTPECYDLGVLMVLLESGKLNADSLATMLLRKADWHDYVGVRLLLESGADPNRMTRWNRTALQQAVLRDNAVEIIELMVDHGADPNLIAGGRMAFAMTARRRWGDLLGVFERRGICMELHGADRLLAACARNDSAAVRSMAEAEPGLVREIVRDGGRLLAEFAGNGNTGGVRLLLDLGVDVSALYREGDAYFDVAANSTALHVAAWRAEHATVKLLLERGALCNAKDAKGRTPLVLAIRACVDSY